MNFTSHSQAAQDLYVKALIVDAENLIAGTFLDIGCCHPIDISNTYALEQLGWRGLLVDNDENAVNLCRQHRQSPAICCDATRHNWALELAKHFDVKKPIDYLSIDVDGATTAALMQILASGARFRVITCEHDSYRFGPGPRDAMREMLGKAGYGLVCGDVHSEDGCAFEDWWFDPEKVSHITPMRIHRDGKKWRIIADALASGQSI